MPSSVGERFLEEAERGLVGRGTKPTRGARRVERDLEAGLSMARDQPVERGEPDRKSSDVLLRAALAQTADDVVNLRGRLPSHLLDCLEGGERATGVLSVAQPGCAGTDGDQADRMTGGVMQISRDPRALLGRREQSFALRVTPGGRRVSARVFDLLSSEARSLAGEPGPGPGQAGVKELAAGDRPLRGGGRGQIRAE